MLWTRMSGLFFHNRCIFCQELTHSPLDLCQFCVELLPDFGAACESCAVSLPIPSQYANKCAACQCQPPPVRYTIARCSYAFPADFLIQQLKFAQQLKYARVMGGLLAQAVCSASQYSVATPESVPDGRPVTDRQYLAIDRIVPVPLSPKRYRERGFNQAAELARFTAKALGLTVCRKTLRRPLDQQPQAKLGRVARKSNILGAFSCEQSVSGEHLVLVDDVMTTGATVFEAAKTLRRAGAASVDIWVFARTA